MQAKAARTQCRRAMFRKTIFWTHLVLGISGGVFIAIMSFTGAALAFEKELIAWAERDARRIDVAPASVRLSLDELVARVQRTKPDARITTVMLWNDPLAAIAVGLPGNVTLYANPDTAELKEPQAPRLRAFLQTMRAWHTRLNFKPTPGRPTLGAKLNAAANVGFVLLCMTGLIVWWPRAWNARVLRPSLWFVRQAAGKARDWNWHNVIGFWMLPALFIMAVTGVVLSYRWAGDLVFTMTGETPPAQGPRPPNSPANAANATPRTSATPLRVDSLLARTLQTIPDWEQITLRFSPPLREGDVSASASAVVRPAHAWPPFATTTLTFDSETGDIRRTEAFGDLSTGTQARRWIRLLHTGEALRWPGELVAGVACLGACVLVWTGLALAWRRFFTRA